MTSRQKLRFIRTPEGIVFPLVLASPLSRFLALAIDVACVLVLSGVLYKAAALARLVNSDWAMAAAMLASAAVFAGYWVLLEWRWRGQTVGKRLLRLRVMDAQGLRLQFSQVLIRNLLRAVDAAPAFYLVGGAAAWVSAAGQRLGDVAANTVVVRVPVAEEPDTAQIMRGMFNSFRDYPHLAARLRQRIAVPEAGILLQALLRRERIEAGARVALFAELRAALERHVRFPPEATDGLSDEQYVRNAADIAFRAADAAE